MPAADIDRERSIRQCIGYDALKFNYIVFCQAILTSLVLTQGLTGRQVPS